MITVLKRKASSDEEGVEIPPNQTSVTTEQLSVRTSTECESTEYFTIDLYQQALQVISNHGSCDH